MSLGITTNRCTSAVAFLMFTLAAACGSGGGGGGGGAVAPSELTYEQNPASYAMATAVTNNLSSAGGAASSFTIAPALPDGLAFDAATGSISGTPAAITPEQSYTITATNDFGSATVDLVLRVTDAAPVVIYPANLIAVTGGIEMATVMPSSTGGAASGFMIDPPLPAGLTLDAATGEISGTATQVAGSWTYRVTASNEGGSDVAEFQLEVVAPALNVTVQPSPSTVVGGGTTWFAASADGVGALSYQWLVDGAAIAGANGASFTTPSVTAADDGTRYQLRVSDGFGSIVTSEPAELGVVGGQFAPAVSLATPRGRHTSTLLADGSVLIAGGQTALGSGHEQTSLLVDATAAAVSAGADLTQERTEHVAVRLADGRVLMSGNREGAPSAAAIYVPDTGTFQPTAGAQLLGRCLHTATLLGDGRVLITGGVSSGVASASAELFDPVSETFAAAGSMTTARRSHTATLLSNGLVLITGGGAAATASAELFDPSTGTFTAVGNMISARQRHFAVRLGDGKVLVGGGHDGVDILSTTEVFDPALGAFLPTDNLNKARESAAAQLLGNGRVVVAGGIGAGNNPNSMTEVYDPVVERWLVSGALATPRAGLSPTLLCDGTWLVPGGEGATGMIASSEVYVPEIPSPAAFRKTGNMTGRSQFGLSLLPDGRALVAGGSVTGSLGMQLSEIYDPASGAWSRTGDLNYVRMGALQLLLPNGKVLAVGGQEILFGQTATAELFDAASGTWSATASMVAARSSMAGSLMSDGKVLVTGGMQISSVMDTAEVFDPASETWSSTGVMSTPRRSHHTVALNNGKVLVIGGMGPSSELLTSCELYDPITGAFTPTGSMSAGRADAMVSLLPDGRVLACGGGSLFTVHATAEVYSPVTETWAPVGSMTTPRRGAAVVTMPDGDVLIASGYGSSFMPVTSAEVFDLETGTFSPADDLDAACEDAKAVLLPTTGRALLVGDFDNGAAVLFR